jgi:hypothetical protein
MYEAALYYPMVWDGTADSIEITYEELSDSRFFGTGGIAILRDLTDDCTAAGVGEYTTVSGGKGYQTSYFFTRDEGSTSMAMSYSPGFKKGDSQTSPNKVLYQTHLKLVRSSATTIDLYSKRPVDTGWDHQTKEITELGDYYFIVHQSQTRSGNGSYFSNLKINGEEILIGDQDVLLLPGEEHRISLQGHLGQKLGENWSGYAVQSADESVFSASIENGRIVITNLSTISNVSTDIIPVTVTALKDGVEVVHTLYCRTKIDQVDFFKPGEAKKYSVVDYFNQGAGEMWGNYTIQVADDSKYMAGIENDTIIITNLLEKGTITDTPVAILITGDKDAETVQSVLLADMKIYFEMDTIELNAFLQKDEALSIDKGEAEGEFYFNTYQHVLSEGTDDQCTFLYESVAMEDSSDITVLINEFVNSGEYSKVGLMLRADNLNGNKQYVALLVTPEEGLKFQYRWKEGTEAVVETVELEEGVMIDQKVPVYLKIRKIGKWFYPYVSNDGTTWHIARKYAFPLEMIGDTYHAGFAAITSANFGLPTECHITGFKVTVGEDMGLLNDDLPMFKSVELDEPSPEMEMDIVPQFKVFSTLQNMVVAEYHANNAGTVRAGLLDLSGRMVRQFEQVKLGAGIHRITYNLSGLLPGIYLIKFDTISGPVVHKVLVK